MDNFWNEFPYTDYQKINLDYMLEKFPEFESRIKALEESENPESVSSIYFVTYGVTSFSDISSALADGKFPVLKAGNNYGMLNAVFPVNISFFRMSGGIVYNYVINEITGWATYTVEYVTTQSPHFTGIPTAPTAADGTNSSQIATTAFVKQAIDTIPQGGDLNTAVKEALLQLARKVAYIDNQGQTYYQDLYNALYDITPVELLSISAVYTQSGTVYETDSLDSLKTNLVVTATYSDSSTAIIPSADYTLSGTLNVGISTIVVSYSGKTTTFQVTVTAGMVTLVSISAVYTQSGTVYDTDSLDSLKTNLVVTATYSDNSTAIVPSADYTLSGTLSAGTSTITVSYSGITDTFTVTVTTTTIYSLSNRVFDGVDDYEDTNIQLLLNDTAFTIFIDFTPSTFSNDSALLHCMHETGNYAGFFLGERTQSGTEYFRHSFYSSGGTTYFHQFDTNRHKYIITHAAGDANAAIWYFDSNAGSSAFGSKISFVSVTEALLIGCYQNSSGVKGRFWSGTVHECKIWDRVLTSSEISDLMGD